MSRREKDDANEFAVLFSFCYTIVVILTLGLAITSVYGMVDAQNETSSKKAQEVQDKIDAWTESARVDFA